MAALIVQLVKNGILLQKIINNLTHWYILTVLAKEVIVLEFEFKGFLFERIKLFSIHFRWSAQCCKIDSNFLGVIGIAVGQNRSWCVQENWRNSKTV